MKCYFNLFIIFLFLSTPVFSEEFSAEYTIKTKGVVIGSLFWYLHITPKKYDTSIKLKSQGILSGLYKFNGEYKSVGTIHKKRFVPKSYVQDWNTKKKKKVVKIIFQNNKVKELYNLPIESEKPRIDYTKINNFVDPVASILDILENNIPSYTIDGRRAYTMFPTMKKSELTIKIKDYVNIWADHKRNDLEYIEIIKSKNYRLPQKINIKFKGMIFSLTKN